MGNIIVRKMSEEVDMDFAIEVKKEKSTLNTYGFYGAVCNHGYTTWIELEKIGEELIAFSLNPTKNYLLDFGNAFYTGTLELEFFPAQRTGVVDIRVKTKIDSLFTPNGSEAESCCFYINSELGLIENFGRRLKGLAQLGVYNEIALNPE